MNKEIKDVAKMIDNSNKIQESSSNIMAFLVDDLLDFAQLNAGKFRRTVKKFDLKEAIDEIVSIQKEKASMSGIQLSSEYIQQKNDGKIATLFTESKKLQI